MATRFAAWAAMAGGAAWALTPVRDLLYGAPIEQGSVAYAVYEGLVAVVAVLLAVGLRTIGRVSTTGTMLVLVGYAMIVVGAVPVGSAELQRTLADIGFFGAMVAAVGAIPLGVALWRRGVRTAGALLVLTLPVGLPLLVAVAAAGQEGVAGLAMTVPYGIAWCLLGGRAATDATQHAASPAAALSR